MKGSAWGTLRRVRPQGPQSTKEAAALEKDLFDLVADVMGRVQTVAVHTGDRGLTVKWRHALRDHVESED